MHEVDQIGQGSIQLPNDVLHGQHHPQRHVPVQHCHGRQHRDHNIFGFIDKNRTCLLVLVNRQILHIDPKQSRLNALPLPTLLLFVVIQLDFRHAVDQLDQHALVFAQLRKLLVIELPPLLHEEVDPNHIQHRAHNKHQQDFPTVNGQHNPKNDQVEERKQYAEGLRGQKALNPSMILDALHQVANHFGIEKADGQLHQLNQEIGNNGDVDPGTDVQQNPRSHKVDRHFANEQHHLGRQHQVDKPQILIVDSHVDDALGQERKDELDDARSQETDHQLPHQASVRPDVSPQKRETRSVGHFIVLVVKCRRWLQHQANTFFFAGRHSSQPVLLKLLLAVFHQAKSRVRHIHLVFFHLVHHHKMILVPVHDTRLGNILHQLGVGNLGSQASHANGFGRIADAQQGNPLARNVRLLP